MEPRSPLTSRYPHFFTIAPSFSRVPKWTAAPPWSLLRCRSSAQPYQVPPPNPALPLRNHSLGPRSTKVPPLKAMAGRGNGRGGGGNLGVSCVYAGGAEGDSVWLDWVTAAKVGEGGPRREAVLRACRQGRWEWLGVLGHFSFFF